MTLSKRDHRPTSLRTNDVNREGFIVCTFKLARFNSRRSVQVTYIYRGTFCNCSLYKIHPASYAIYRDDVMEFISRAAYPNRNLAWAITGLFHNDTGDDLVENVQQNGVSKRPRNAELLYKFPFRKLVHVCTRGATGIGLAYSIARNYSNNW